MPFTLTRFRGLDKGIDRISRIHNETDIEDGATLAATGKRLQDLGKVLTMDVPWQRRPIVEKGNAQKPLRAVLTPNLQLESKPPDVIGSILATFVMKGTLPALNLKEDKTPTANDTLRQFEILDTMLNTRRLSQTKYDRKG